MNESREYTFIALGGDMIEETAVAPHRGSDLQIMISEILPEAGRSAK
jgi:hypothetical protein